MSSSNSIIVKQLAHRLESASSNDRIDALQELQSLARSSPDSVGEIALKKTFELLREQSSAEECCEALDLTYRLVKCRDKEIAKRNTSIILSDIANVELLLDLLEHVDLTVGVMTSQILTELHLNNGSTLEQQIHNCPDGMNKLLQRLPDSSREEVRNQAIVLIQQLTSSNEEMKKTVVFNEGFEILFRIIIEEGGSDDAGIVVGDCLKICNNILSGSETCQRLFFAMGSQWILKLSDFFNPILLEKIGTEKIISDVDNNNLLWFDETTRLSCAISALMILCNALSTRNEKHQNIIIDSAPTIISSVGYWIARCGPIELISASLSLLHNVVDKNPNVGFFLSNLQIKITPNNAGKNIPTGVDIGNIQFGWKPLPKEDVKYVTLLSLLAERFIFPLDPWTPNGCLSFEKGLHLPVEIKKDISGGSMSFDKACLFVLEKILSSDSTMCDMMIQYILAPPPPPAGDFDEYGTLSKSPSLESMRPLGQILVSMLMSSCEKLLHANSHQYTGIGTSRNEFDNIERVANVLSLIFLNGSQLARELSTAISSHHLKSIADHKDHSQSVVEMEIKFLLPTVLASVGRAARLPNGSGYSFLISVLQWLSIVVCGCERATRQMFEDPSNLFVVDLATASSETAGIPPIVQVMSCLFLSCCCSGFPDKMNEQSQGADGGMLQRKSFLSMIDSRIGLNRFAETLKKPLVKKQPQYDQLFWLPGFKEFYQLQVENIRTIIFELYSGSSNDLSGGSSMQQQIISMQMDKIRELEEKVKNTVTDQKDSSKAENEILKYASKITVLEAEVEMKQNELFAADDFAKKLNIQLNEEIEFRKMLEKSISNENEKCKFKDDEIVELTRSNQKLKSELSTLYAARARDESNFLTMQESLRIAQSQIEEMKQQNHSSRSSELKVENCEEEIIKLKEVIISESNLKKQYFDSLEQCDRKLKLLESELTTLRSSQGSETATLHDIKAKLQNTTQELSLKESFINNLQQTIAEMKLVQNSSEQQIRETLARNILDLVSSVEDSSILEAVQSYQSYKDPLELQNILSSFRSYLIDVAGKCSDIAEGAGIQLFQSREGSVPRIVDCCCKLSEMIEELENLVAEQESKLTAFQENDNQKQLLENKLKDFEQQLQLKLDEGETSFAAYKMELKKLQEEKDSADVKFTSALSNFNVRLSELEQINNALAEERDQALLSLNESKQQLNQKEDLQNNLANEADMMQRQLKQLNELLQQTQSENQQADKHSISQLVDVKAENHALKQKLHELEELVQSSEKQLQRALEANIELLNQKDAVETELAQVLEIQADLEKECNSFSQQLSESEEELQISRKYKTKYLSMLDTLTAAKFFKNSFFTVDRDDEFVDHLNQFLLHYDYLVQVDTNNQTLLVDLRETIASLQSAHDHSVAELKSSIGCEKAGLKNEIVKLEKEVAELKGKLMVVENEKSENAIDDNTSIQPSQDEIASMTAKLLKLNEDIELEKLNVLVYQSELSESKVRVEDLENLLKSKQELLDHCGTVKEDLLREKDSLWELYQKKIKEVEYLDADNKQKVKVFEELNILKEDLHCQYDEEKQTSTHLQGLLKSSLESKSFIISELEKSLAEEKSVSEDLKISIENLKQETNSVSHELSVQSLFVKDLQDQIELLEAKLENMRTEKKILSSEKQAVQLSLFEIQNQHILKCEEASALGESIANAEASVKHLQTLLQEKHETYATQVKNLQFDLEKEQKLNAHVSQVFESQYQEMQVLHEEQINELKSKLQNYLTAGESHTQLENRCKGLESIVVTLETQLQEKEHQLSKLMIQVSSQLEEIKLLQRKASDQSQYFSYASDSNELSPFHLQQAELKRLSNKIDALTGELHDKNHELQKQVSQIHEKQTLLATLQATMQGYKDDIKHLRKENEYLQQEKFQNDKRVRELMWENQILSEHSTANQVSDNDGLNIANREKVMKAMQEIIIYYNKLIEKYNISSEISDCEFTENSLTVIDFPRVVDYVQRAMKGCIQKIELELESCSKLLARKEKVFESNTIDSMSRQPQTLLATPVKSGKSPNNEIINQFSTPETAGKMSAAKSMMLNVSPTIKEAARLNSEVMKERKKYLLLQEQHTELLGLLAQQEVEISVFRQVMTDKMGDETVSSVEEEAQQNVIRLYGAYTHYRKYQDLL